MNQQARQFKVYVTVMPEPTFTERKHVKLQRHYEGTVMEKLPSPFFFLIADKILFKQNEAINVATENGTVIGVTASDIVPTHSVWKLCFEDADDTL